MTEPNQSSAHASPVEESKFKEFIRVRRELLKIELQEAGHFLLGKGMRIGLILFGFLFFWLLLLLAGISFLGEQLSQRVEYLGWEFIALCVAFCHLCLAVIALMSVRKKPKEPLFQYSLQELKNDSQWLKNQDNNGS